MNHKAFWKSKTVWFLAIQYYFSISVGIRYCLEINADFLEWWSTFDGITVSFVLAILSRLGAKTILTTPKGWVGANAPEIQNKDNPTD